MTIRAVLLDAGNTIVEIDYDYVARAIRAAGGEATAGEVRRAERRARVPLDALLGAGSTEAPDVFWAYMNLVIEHLPGKPPPDPTPVFEAIAAHGSLWNRADPDAAGAIARLHEAGYRLGVVSNSDGNVERQLRVLGLREHLEVVVDSGVVGMEKPDPAIFRIALDALGVSASDTVYVGDLPSIDLAGAHAAGLLGILVDPLDLWGDVVDGPRIRGIGDLPDAIAGLDSNLP